jgi:diguanylate cyclase (GGDEF)-like protein/PAS domain S-box-containing protein
MQKANIMPCVSLFSPLASNLLIRKYALIFWKDITMKTSADDKKTEDTMASNKKMRSKDYISYGNLESFCRSKEGACKDLRARYRALYECTFYCLYIHDIEGRFLDANNAALKLLGYTREEMSSLHLSSFFPREQFPSALRFIQHLKKTGLQKNPFEFRLKKKDGEYLWVEAEASVIYNEGSPYAIQWIARDITSRKKSMEELHSLSIIDDLTGLYNRRGFLTLAEQQLRLANRMNKDMLLLFTDIDNLKLINDKLGHHEGDSALIDTANILRQTFRGSDIIARIGGDEFVVLTIDASSGAAETVTKRLQDNLDMYHRKNGHNYRLSLSTGITMHHAEESCSVSNLLESADKLMYHQKRSKQHRLPVFNSESRTGRKLLAEVFANS